MAAFADAPEPSPFEGAPQGAVYVRPSAEALAVAERVGLPPGFEAWRLRLFLERHARSRHVPLPLEGTRALAGASLRTLARIAPDAQLGKDYRLLLARTLVPAALLVAAGILLGARAGRQKSPSTRSATMR